MVDVFVNSYSSRVLCFFFCFFLFFCYLFFCFVFFQAEDGIRDLVRSRGLGDVYKRQHLFLAALKGWLLEQSEVVAALMSGSGSTVFAITRHGSDATALVPKVQQWCGETSWVRATVAGPVSVSYTPLTPPTNDLV